MQSLSKWKLQAERFSHKVYGHKNSKIHKNSKNHKNHKNQVNTNFISALGISLPGVYFFREEDAVWQR